MIINGTQIPLLVSYSYRFIFVMMIQDILRHYGLENAKMELFGNGLINRTWKVCAENRHYILQRVHDQIFKQPPDIADNIRRIADYLQQNHPDYFFVRPVASCKGDELTYVERDGYYRLFPFVEGSHTVDVVKTPGQAYEAAAQFGKFTRLLAGFNARQLKATIPDFHNVELRFQQFFSVLKNGNDSRKSQSKKLIEQLMQYQNIVSVYCSIQSNRQFQLRVTHHDTKISNVLFNAVEKAICVIDLDTVMPGYFISDAGDMMRTYLSPVSEEESDISQITVRDEFYEAIVLGYHSEMKDNLTKEEKEHFFYAGQFMIYMQALRFLTDHLNNDVYYGAKYEGQNFVRARNQLVLLQRLMEKKDVLQKIK